MGSLEDAKRAVRLVLASASLDEPIVEYLARLLDEAQSDPSSRPGLEEALHDLSAAGEDTDASKTAQRILDLAAAGVQQELDASAATSPAPEAGQQAKAAVTAPAQKAMLNVSAAAFVPRSAATAVATAQHPLNLLPAVSPVVDATPSPQYRDHASWAPAEHQSYACDWSAASNAKLTAGGAAELLSLWFPQYGATALQQLFEINQDLFKCVDELLLMEGEEPFESRLDTDVGTAAATSQAALSDSDFPTLRASSQQQQQQQRRHTSSQPRWNYAKDILPKGSSGVQPSTAGTGWGRSSDASAATVKQFWDQRPQGWPAEGGPHRPQASGARASVPTVETGDKLKQLYEQARAEAKDHALKRITCFRQAAAAYINGNRDLARRLSARAQQHGQDMAEADAKAAQHIFWARNASAALTGASPFLDLHGLHVKEACALLVSVLEQRQGGAGATRSSSGGSLTICTGVGKHSDRLLKSGAGSAGGRLEAALERVLRSRGIDFKLVQPGLFKVS